MTEVVQWLKSGAYAQRSFGVVANDWQCILVGSLPWLRETGLGFNACKEKIFEIDIVIR